MRGWHLRIAKRGVYTKVTFWNVGGHAGTLVLNHNQWEELRPLVQQLPDVTIDYRRDENEQVSNPV